MRIISGKLKGRKINPPKSIKVRPTTDFAKESLFNILENKINFETIKVLDLFAGTGNISFEFASRGTKDITCIDKSYHSVKYINQMSTDFVIPVKAFKSNVFKFLLSHKEKYDVIFADPPYNLKTIVNIPELIFNGFFLKKNGLLIIEHGFENDLSDHKNFIDKRTYSRVNFSFFKSS